MFPCVEFQGVFVLQEDEQRKWIKEQRTDKHLNTSMRLLEEDRLNLKLFSMHFIAHLIICMFS